MSDDLLTELRLRSQMPLAAADWIERLQAENDKLKEEVERLQNKKCVHQLAKEYSESVER